MGEICLRLLARVERAREAVVAAAEAGLPPRDAHLIGSKAAEAKLRGVHTR